MDVSLETLRDRLDGLSTLALLEAAILREFPGRIAVVSSFGAESAVLLDLVAEVDPATPVIFIDTLRHFPETLRYRDRLAERLGLTDVRRVAPDPEVMGRIDPLGALCRDDHDRCCRARKVAPLGPALDGFDAWISGRKRFHGAARDSLPTIEAQDGRIKINPLADWSANRIEAAFVARDLPRHPMVADGFLSIGCMPCTARTEDADDPRSGRWAGKAKTECGIHLGCSERVPG